MPINMPVKINFLIDNKNGIFSQNNKFSEDCIVEDIIMAIGNLERIKHNLIHLLEDSEEDENGDNA